MRFFKQNAVSKRFTAPPPPLLHPPLDRLVGFEEEIANCMLSSLRIGLLITKVSSRFPCRPTTLAVRCFTGNSEIMYGSFETERLAVVPWNGILSDPDEGPRQKLFAELSGILDEQVTAFLPESLVFHEGSDASKWAETFSDGSDISSVRLQKTDKKDLAGVLLLRTENPGDIHVGYIFGKAHWGQGLASELLRGLVGHMTASGYDGVMHAGVAHGNPASVAVLKKVGFEPVEGGGESGKDTDFFRRSFLR